MEALLVKYITTLIGKEVKDNDNFSKRINNRNKIFWEVPDADGKEQPIPKCLPEMTDIL